MPFSPSPPQVYVAKVKRLLTGLAPDPNEVSLVQGKSDSMQGLVQQWLARPEAQQVLTDFFTTAFQQKNLSAPAMGVGVSGDSCGEWWGIAHNHGFVRDRDDMNQAYTKNFSESFGRTVWQLTMVENQPFTTVLTTRRFMMTPAMVSTMLFMDRYRTNMGIMPGTTPSIGGCGNYGYRDVYSNLDPNSVYKTYVANYGAIPIEQTLDPNSAHYMQWNTADNTTGLSIPGLDTPTLLSGPDALYQFINGFFYTEDPVFAYCPVKPVWTADDFSQWKMVSFPQANPNVLPMRFWDVPLMRTATEVPLVLPRVGFFSTPAFYGNWGTNGSNQFRVTANQTLIVALGASLLDADVILRSVNGSGSENNTDAAHLANPACSGCHVILDPFRNFFAQGYSTEYQATTDASAATRYGQFTLDNINVQGKSLDDLGVILGSDPAFARNWVGRFCIWANTFPCDTSDPEFERIVAGFVASKFNLRAMLTDLFSSPLVTGASYTSTWSKNGEPLSIQRYNHFCTNLSQRLALPNACTVNTVTSQNSSNIPVDNYNRGSSAPYLPSQPNLFTWSAAENLCVELAQQVVDGPSTVFASSAVSDAIELMITQVMAMTPNDSRYAAVEQLLQAHYAAALAQGASTTDALRSTFTIACTSPTSLGVGF